MSAQPATIKPIRTDRQAERAAERKLRLDRRYAEIEQREKDAVDWLEQQIASARKRYAAQKDRVERTRKPLHDELLAFANDKRGKRKSYVLPNGIELEVNTTNSVVVVGGDDKVGIAALEAAGMKQFIRRPPAPPAELNRALLRQKGSRYVFDTIDVLYLKPAQTVKVKLPK